MWRENRASSDADGVSIVLPSPIARAMMPREIDARIDCEIVTRRWRRLALGPASEVARVVLDAGAEPDLLDRLEVVHRALLEPLALEQLSRRVAITRRRSRLNRLFRRTSCYSASASGAGVQIASIAASNM
jgi:transcriptional regulator GlxA family with amidase domain